MEIKVLEKEKNKLKIEIIGENHTFCNSLRKELWNDDDVKVAGYNIEHPLVAHPVLVLETDKKDPKKVLDAAIKRLKDRNEKIRGAVKAVSKNL
ncbi:DNA-directed RNA polymerase subunit L [Candidatus Woesearchaeota archaeon]|nr:DNA-directed RNA polymerase subunit L [Candidatus Woesearchaeota archaeon]